MSTCSISDIAQALTISKRSAERRAASESWSYHETPVRGGRMRLYEIDKLPKAVRSAIKQHKMQTDVLPAVVSEIAAPAVAQCNELSLTHDQRAIRDARSGIRAVIHKTMAELGCSLHEASVSLICDAQRGTLDPILTRMLHIARDRRGSSRGSLPTPRTLRRWLANDDLAPTMPQKDFVVPVWAREFLAHYQQPQKPSLSDAYRQFAAEYAGDLPSEWQVRRFVGKLGAVTRERGRMGERELRNIQPFVRRDFAALLPNDIWSPDGHTFDAEVQHPFTGKAFRPEITTYIDIATRRAVGWSVDLAESSMAVADALRSAVQKHGIPAMIYSDNGSGYKNAYLEDTALGLLGRLGITVRHSIPYNSQARGVIERAHQTIWVRSAKRLPSYMGHVMDRQARLAHYKLTRAAIKHGGAMPLMPWQLFVEFCEEAVAAYNAAPHRSLGGVSPELCWRNHEARGWTPTRIEGDEVITLFRPRVARTLRRGEIQIFNNLYFAREFEEFNGALVHVAFDIHDPRYVWVYLPDGRFVGTAEVNGNRRNYYPVAVIEQARDQRAKARLARIEVKRDDILDELHGAAAIEVAPAQTLVIGGRVIEADEIDQMLTSAPAEPLNLHDAPATINAAMPLKTDQPAAKPPRSERSAEDNYAEWCELRQRQQNGEILLDVDARFIETWPTTMQGSSHLDYLGLRHLIPKKQAVA